MDMGMTLPHTRSTQRSHDPEKNNLTTMFWQLSWPEFWFVLYRYNQRIWEQLRSKDCNVPLKADEYLSPHFKKGNFRIKCILVPWNCVTCWNVPHVDSSYKCFKLFEKRLNKYWTKTKHLSIGLCCLVTMIVCHEHIYTYSGAKKYLVSHQLCKFSHLKRWERPVIFIIGIPQLWETK